MVGFSFYYRETIQNRRVIYAIIYHMIGIIGEKEAIASTKCSKRRATDRMKQTK
jgi:hypothetical protein